MKKLHNAKWFMLGMVVCLLISALSGQAFAKMGEEQIVVSYRNIVVMLNGVQLSLKDANGNFVEPFVYNGTTYLPIRSIGEALGLHVGWNETTNTATLSNTPLQQPVSPPVQQPIPQTPMSRNVWIPRTGVKYHSYSTCSNMKNPSYVELSRAIQMGYTACSKCW